ncbi:unnamed protein product, partial [Medioppia subpectinata]
MDMDFPRNTSIYTKCRIVFDERGVSKKDRKYFTDPFTQYNPNAVIFSPTIRSIQRSLNEYNIALNTNDRSVRVLSAKPLGDFKDAYNPDEYAKVPGGVIEMSEGNCTHPVQCRRPAFVNQIPDHLLPQLEGVVDYDLGGGQSGYMLLFNSSGQPRYCFTPEGKDLSKQ